MINDYQTTRRHNSDYSNFHSRWNENVRSDINILKFSFNLCICVPHGCIKHGNWFCTPAHVTVLKANPLLLLLSLADRGRPSWGQRTTSGLFGWYEVRRHTSN
jgi:hypothetical protein